MALVNRNLKYSEVPDTRIKVYTWTHYTVLERPVYYVLHIFRCQVVVECYPTVFCCLHMNLTEYFVVDLLEFMKQWISIIM